MPARMKFGHLKKIPKIYIHKYKMLQNLGKAKPAGVNRIIWLARPGLCKDVSSLGRWGNGDVEVGLSSMDEMPYVLGLVCQSFEKQMGNGIETTE